MGPRRIVGGSADGFIARVCHCIQEKTLRLCYKSAKAQISSIGIQFR